MLIKKVMKTQKETNNFCKAKKISDGKEVIGILICPVAGFSYIAPISTLEHMIVNKNEEGKLLISNLKVVRVLENSIQMI